MQKLLLGLSTLMLALLVACGTGQTSNPYTYVSPYGESVVGNLDYFCAPSLDGQTAQALLSVGAVPSVSPSAFIQVSSGFVIESQLILVSSLGNCTSSTISATPVCTYAFTWSLAAGATPLQTIPFQLNGASGESNLTQITLGGSICSGS